MEDNFYQFTARSLQGEDISMDTYRGKVVLIVNTASKCGFTPQYEGLEKLYETYKDKGFVILDFHVISLVIRNRAQKRRSLKDVWSIMEFHFRCFQRLR